MEDSRDKASLGAAHALRPEVLRAFFGRFGSLRPVQEAAFLPIREGKDVLILSPTGSGKTEAAIAPLIDRWYEHLRGETGVVLLYVSPTKALINDLRQRLGPAFAALGVGLGIRHGDRSEFPHRHPPNLLITTPESLDVLLGRRDEALSSIRAVVVDEIHLLYNSQRGLQLGILLNRLRNLTGLALQIVGMSGSVADPHDLVRFLLGTGTTGSIEIVHDATRKPIKAHLRLLRQPGDLRRVVERLMGGRSGKLLLFADSRRQCDAISSALRESASLSGSVYLHYSSLAPEVREETERRFAAQRQAICVATSTLELGIDIGDIDATLLFGAPPTHESFLQRIGRGNRRTDEAQVVCLVPPQSPRPLLDALAHLALLERVLEGHLEREEPFALFGAAVQQILSHLYSRRGAFVRVADFAALLATQSHLDRGVVESILSHLADEGVLTRHGFKHQFGAGEGFHRLASLRLLFGNYPLSLQAVAVVEGNRELGRIPAINLLRLEPGGLFRFGGRVWEVRRVDRDGLEVRSAVPRGPVRDIVYPGMSPGPSAAVLGDICSLLENGRVNYDLMGSEDGRWVEERVKPLRDALADGGVPVVQGSEGGRYLTFGGRLVNRALSLSVGDAGTAPDDLFLTTPHRLDLSSLPDSLGHYEPFLMDLMQLNEQATLFQSLLPTELARRELTEVWFKTPAHAATLVRLRHGRPRPIPPTALDGLGSPPDRGGV
ncbi:MAG: DEAD/DEAH box helicase [Acidobacteria bacterium]|nr:DEAD/DEAH box helicase [Acidobacteriota bacterium]